MEESTKESGKTENNMALESTLQRVASLKRESGVKENVLLGSTDL